MERKLIQCSRCGHIYNTNQFLNEDDTYIDSICPKCGNSRGLFVGNNIIDMYELYDVNVDPRFYNY